MTDIITAGKTCDASCLAPAAVEVLLFGQDFAFCQHHYRELGVADHHE